MNYRHAFHAGNHADVLKHMLFAAALARLTAKPKPLVAIDAFAGAGLYDLALDDRPARTGEHAAGVGRIWPARAERPAAAAPYLETLADLNPDGALRWLPGSPRLALALMRAEDKLLAIERHPEEAEALDAALGGDPRARLYAGDAWTLTTAFLPPTPRRGIVLIDPPYEAPNELERALSLLETGLRRWSTGVYALWRPVKNAAEEPATDRRLTAIAGGRPTLSATLWSGAQGGFLGSTLTIVNPPYGLEADVEALGPFLATALGQGAALEHCWLSPPR